MLCIRNKVNMWFTCFPYQVTKNQCSIFFQFLGSEHHCFCWNQSCLHLKTSKWEKNAKHLYLCSGVCLQISEPSRVCLGLCQTQTLWWSRVLSTRPRHRAQGDLLPKSKHEKSFALEKRGRRIFRRNFRRTLALVARQRAYVTFASTLISHHRRPCNLCVSHWTAFFYLNHGNTVTRVVGHVRHSVDHRRERAVDRSCHLVRHIPGQRNNRCSRAENDVTRVAAIESCSHT